MLARFASALFAAVALSSTAALAAPTDSPRGLADAIYRQIMRDRTHPTSLDAYLTSHFAADLALADATERRYHTLILDAPPFIGMQVEAGSYEIRPPTIRGTTARVPVLLKQKGYPNSVGILVTLVAKKTPRGWLVDDILDRTGASTDAAIHREVAMTIRYRATHGH